MEDHVVLGGRRWNIGEVKRDGKMLLKEQLECLEEEYVGFHWISVSQGVIKFYYIRRA